ncbi:hypothetical protein C2G38_2082247 [Gigaspora rosea]|uniref:Uncharacterized protein n=1 Tax=Gigaspora rosea TaxID=44941 RepID=A0A397VBH0_9GLOM|nr:hypothetical protein C2G38_2082247 [Gigaspora rosea]
MSIPMKDDKVTSQENSNSEWIDFDNDDLVNENTGIIQVGNKSEEDSTEQSTTTFSDNSQINLTNDSDEITQKLLNVWIQSSCGYNTRFGSFNYHLYLIFGDYKAYAYIYISRNIIKPLEYKKNERNNKIDFFNICFLCIHELISITFNIAKTGLMWVRFFTVIKYIKNNYRNMKNVVCELLE